MGVLGKMTWQGQGPTAQIAILKQIDERAIPDGMRTGVVRLAEGMEDYARQNAPWTDRTGNARGGLFGFSGEDGEPGGPQTFVAGISHGPDIDYAKYLETMQNGRFAIIAPTQEVFAEKAAEVMIGEVEDAIGSRGARLRHKRTGRFV